MPEKILTESEWKKFAKGRSLKDAPLLKSMADLVKAERVDADTTLRALDDLEKQSELLLKANKSDKELASQLSDVAKAVAKQRKLVEAESKAAAKAEESEEEDASPAQLTTKLIPLMREVRKGNSMHALVALGGPLAAVLLSRRPITASSRKLLAGELEGGGSIKYFPAQCIFEANAYTFVLETLPAGVAKKLRAALLKQTEQRYKVRARSSDPNEVDDDGVPIDADEHGKDGEDGDDPVRLSAEESPKAAENAKGEGPAHEPQNKEIDPERARFDARLREMRSAIERFIQSGVPEAVKLKPLLDFATGKAAEGLHKAAHQGLDAAAKLIEKAGQKETVEAEIAPSVDALARTKARLAEMAGMLKTALDAGRDGAADQRTRMAQAVAAVGKQDFDLAGELMDGIESWLNSASSGRGNTVSLQQSRLAWDGLRKRIGAQLSELEQAVLKEVRAYNEDADNDDEYDESELTEGLARLNGLLERLDTRLIDKLDEAMQATGDEHQKLQREAQAIVDEYRAFVASDTLIAEIDANGFIDTAIRSEAEKTLSQLTERLLAA